MKTKRFTIAVLLLFAYTYSFEQELPENTKQQLENITESLEEEPENDEFLIQLAYLRKEPLNINSVTAEELQVFPFLTDLQIQSLMRYRHVFGHLISIYELQSIPLWDLQTIFKILPFIQISSNTTIKETILTRFKNGENLLVARSSRILEKAQGFNKALPNHYLGDRNRYLIRYKYQYKNLLQYGITADKDAGEPFFKRKNLFDSYSYHLFIRNIGPLKSVAIGDYTINLGQGLIHWQSLAFRKSAEVMNVKRQSAIVKPYSSAGEFYFNRGVATTIQKGKWEGTFFGSVRKLSANIDIDPNNNKIFTSFQTSGLHRTAAEIAEKKVLEQISFGGNLSYHHRSFKLGFNAVESRFSLPFQKQDEPYNLFSRSGKLWRNASLDYSTTYKNIHFFGEAAVDKNRNKAIISGALLSVDPKIDLSILHRSISKGYQSIYGNAFTENSQPVNESGLYMGVSIRPNTIFKINAYADFYKFPWLKYRTDAPSSGKDFLVQMTYQPNKLTEVYTRYRYESKEINETHNNSVTNYVIAKPRQNWRVHFSYAASQAVTIRSRIDMVWYDKKGKTAENGFLIFGEVHYRIMQKLSGNFRFSYFETDGYNSRIYAYENDVLYGYSIPALFDKGNRYYVNASYELTKSIGLWLRFSQSIFMNKEIIGSGLNEIAGNRYSELKFQVLYKF